jgi:flagellar biosynthesis protein FliQ
MSPDSVLRIAREALLLTLVISAAPVLAAVVVGLIVSLFQATTQIQEQTLSAVPKIIAVVVALLVAGPWMVRQLAAFAVFLLRMVQ